MAKQKVMVGLAKGGGNQKSDHRVQPPSLKPASTSISPIAPGGEGHIEMLAGVGGETNFPHLRIFC